MDGLQGLAVVRRFSLRHLFVDFPNAETIYKRIRLRARARARRALVAEPERGHVTVLHSGGRLR